MASIPLSRSQARGGFPEAVRIELLEQDADSADSRHADIQESLAKLNARAMGLLISLVVAAIMLSINLAVK